MKNKALKLMKLNYSFFFITNY